MSPEQIDQIMVKLAILETKQDALITLFEQQRIHQEAVNSRCQDHTSRLLLLEERLTNLRSVHGLDTKTLASALTALGVIIAALGKALSWW